MSLPTLDNLVRIGQLPSNRWRVLDAAHQKRNLAEYEGFLEVEESTLAELCDVVSDLIADVQTLVASASR